MRLQVNLESYFYDKPVSKITHNRNGSSSVSSNIKYLAHVVELAEWAGGF